MQRLILFISTGKRKSISEPYYFWFPNQSLCYVIRGGIPWNYKGIPLSDKPMYAELNYKEIIGIIGSFIEDIHLINLLCTMTLQDRGFPFDNIGVSQFISPPTSPAGRKSEVSGRKRVFTAKKIHLLPRT